MQARLEKINKYQKYTKRDFIDLQNSIFRHGRTDYKLSKQITYKENFLTMLETFKNYLGYEEFKKKIENLSPKEFWNFISKEEGLTDIRYYYDVDSRKSCA